MKHFPVVDVYKCVTIGYSDNTNKIGFCASNDFYNFAFIFASAAFLGEYIDLHFIAVQRIV
ncbi:hypothetical protein D3C86_2250860 [compost metagenome]